MLPVENWILDDELMEWRLFLPPFFKFPNYSDLILEYTYRITKNILCLVWYSLEMSSKEINPEMWKNKVVLFIFGNYLLNKLNSSAINIRCIGFPYSKNTLQNISSRKRLNSIHPIYLLMISENLIKLFIHSLGEIISMYLHSKVFSKMRFFW